MNTLMNDLNVLKVYFQINFHSNEKQNPQQTVPIL